MSGRSQALRSASWGSAAAALILCLLEIGLGPAAMAAGVLAARVPEPGDSLRLGLLVALLAVNTWLVSVVLLRANLLWALGSWPPIPPPGGDDERLALLAAEQAFDQGAFDRVPGLLERVQGRPVGKALGRALFWQGRVEEAGQALAAGGEREWILRWFRPRRWGPRRGSVPLGPGEPGGARRWGSSMVWAMALAAATASVVAPMAADGGARWEKAHRGFDVSDFSTETQGRFVVHFHDPEFKATILPLLNEALDQDLAFYGLGANTFAEGQIQIYLCADQAEYLRRSPAPTAWEAASALPESDSIYFYRMPEGQAVFFEEVAAHELSHLVYHRLGIRGRNDSWLNEGLADYLGYRYALDKHSIPRQDWLQRNMFASLRTQALPFGAFFQMDPHQLDSDDKVALFYRQGFSVVAMLVDQYGRDAFLDFLRHYAATGRVDQSLAKAYPSLQDVDALSAVWGLFYRNDAPADHD